MDSNSSKLGGSMDSPSVMSGKLLSLEQEDAPSLLRQKRSCGRARRPSANHDDVVVDQMRVRLSQAKGRDGAPPLTIARTAARTRRRVSPQ